MKLKQVSIFVENGPGKLYEIIHLLGENHIDIKALSIADTQDYGILRLIVDAPEKTCELLRPKYIVKVNYVIAITVNNEPGGLEEALRLLKDHQIEISYLYAFVGSSEEQASVMLKVSDEEAAVRILTEHHIKMLDSKDIIKEDTI